MSKIVVVGPHFELVYLATKLAENHEVTLIDKYRKIGGSCYDDQFPRYGLNPTSFVPEDLVNLFTPVDIPTAFDNFRQAFTLPMTDWGLRSLGSEPIRIADREEFSPEGLSTYEILAKRLGNQYVDDIVSPLIDAIFNESIAMISPRLVFGVVDRFLEFNKESYLPSGGYSSVCNVMLGYSKVTYETELPTLDELESTYDLILWGDSPFPIYDKYYFDLCAPTVRMLAPKIETCNDPCGPTEFPDPADLYREEVDLPGCFKYLSVAPVDPNGNMPLAAVRVINSSQAYEVANIDVISLGSERGVKGFITVEEGLPLFPCSSTFDTLMDVKFPEKYRFVNQISKYSIPNLTRDLKSVEAEIQYVNDLFPSEQAV